MEPDFSRAPFQARVAERDGSSHLNQGLAAPSPPRDAKYVTDFSSSYAYLDGFYANPYPGGGLTSGWLVSRGGPWEPALLSVPLNPTRVVRLNYNRGRGSPDELPQCNKQQNASNTLQSLDQTRGSGEEGELSLLRWTPPPA